MYIALLWSASGSLFCGYKHAAPTEQRPLTKHLRDQTIDVDARCVEKLYAVVLIGTEQERDFRAAENQSFNAVPGFHVVRDTQKLCACLRCEDILQQFIEVFVMNVLLLLRIRRDELNVGS